MCSSNAFFVTCIVVIHDHFTIHALLQHLFALPGGGEVRQRGLPLLQPLPVESVGAVNVYGTGDVAHVVGYEGATVDNEEGPRAGPARVQFQFQAVGFDGDDLLQHQGALQGRAFGARARGQAHARGLQLEAFRGTQQEMGRRRRAWFTQAPVQRQFEAIPRPTAFETHCRHDAAVRHALYLE